jgi:ubiquitin thioesterase protein OTUB1
MMENAVMGGAQPSLMTPPAGLGAEAGYHIRFSPVQLEYNESQSAYGESFQVTTSTFKNSVFNRAHFGNPDFHPEEWNPENENKDGRSTNRRKTRRDS